MQIVVPQSHKPGRLGQSLLILNSSPRSMDAHLSTGMQVPKKCGYAADYSFSLVQSVIGTSVYPKCLFISFFLFIFSCIYSSLCIPQGSLRYFFLQETDTPARASFLILQAYTRLPNYPSLPEYPPDHRNSKAWIHFWKGGSRCEVLFFLVHLPFTAHPHQNPRSFLRRTPRWSPLFQSVCCQLGPAGMNAYMRLCMYVCRLD